MSTKKINKVPVISSINLAEVKLPEINLKRIKASNKDWVTYGDKNNFPEYLASLLKKSPTHESFINKRQELIASEGFTYSDNVKGFLEKLDDEGGNINDLLSNVATDLSILETFAIAVRYNRLKDKIVALDYIPSANIRPAKQLDEFGKITGYWVCADWSDETANTPVFYEKFNPNKVKETTQIFFYHKRALMQPYLPEVSYSSALNYVELDGELGKYTYSTVVNGFNPSGILNAKANLNDEQKADFARSIKNHFTGSENAAKIMVVVDENSDSIVYTPLSTTDSTPMLKALIDIAVAKIASAHKGNPIIAGITPDGSTLGSDGKLYRDSLEIYYNTVIRNLQKPFIEFIKKVLDFNGFTEYELDITSSALLASALDLAFQADYLKPEVWLASYGYSKEDIKPELLEALEEAETTDEVEAIIDQDKEAVEDINDVV